MGAAGESREDIRGHLIAALVPVAPGEQFAPAAELSWCRLWRSNNASAE